MSKDDEKTRLRNWAADEVRSYIAETEDHHEALAYMLEDAPHGDLGLTELSHEEIVTILQDALDEARS